MSDTGAEAVITIALRKKITNNNRYIAGITAVTTSNESLIAISDAVKDLSEKLLSSIHGKINEDDNDSI